MPLTQPMLNALARALGHFLWQGALIGLVAHAAIRLGRPSASARYLLGVGALLTMAVAPVATTAVLLRQAAPGPALLDLAGTSGRFVATWGPAPAVEPGWTMAAAVVAIWVVGVMALSLRLLGGWAMTRRFVARARDLASPEVRAFANRLSERLALGRLVTVVESPSVTVPMLVGWLKPVVILPTAALSSLAPAQVEALLAHELAHVRRHDYLVNLFQSVVETVLFYHPAVWLVSRDVRQAREECCDDLAVLVCDRVVYASALADLAALAVTPALALAATDGSLLVRVRRILGGQDVTRSSRPGWLPASVLALTLAAVVPLVLSSAPAQDERAALKPATEPTAAVTTTESLAPLPPGRFGHLAPSQPASPALAGQDPVLTPDQIERLRVAMAALEAKQRALKEQGALSDQLQAELAARLAQLGDALSQAGKEVPDDLDLQAAKLKALKGELEGLQKEKIENAIGEKQWKDAADQMVLDGLKEAQDALGQANDQPARAKAAKGLGLTEDERREVVAQATAALQQLAERQGLGPDADSLLKMKKARLQEIEAELSAKEAVLQAGGGDPPRMDLENLKSQLSETEGALAKLAKLDQEGKAKWVIRGPGAAETPLDSKDTLGVLAPVLSAGPNDVSVVGTFTHPGHVAWHEGLTVADALKAAGAPAIGDPGIAVRRLSGLQVTFGPGGTAVAGEVDGAEAATVLRPGDVILVTRAPKAQ